MNCPAPSTVLAQAFACAALMAPPAQAQVQDQLPADAVPRAVVLAARAAQAMAPQGARITVEPGTLDPRLQLAPCTRVDAYLPAGVGAWGRTRVGLRCSQGATAWRVLLPVTVHVWAPAAVLSATLPAGARLDASHLLISEIDWASGGALAHADIATLQGRVLSRPLASGVAPRTTDLAPRHWFALGDTVRVTASGNGFSISAEAQALTPGLEGQPARVRTESGRVLSGQAVGDRRVEIKL